MAEEFYCTQHFYLNTNSADFVEFNKQVLYRATLPCHPVLFKKDLFMDIELMIYGLKPNDSKTHKFNVERDQFATIQKSTLRITDPMSRNF